MGGIDVPPADVLPTVLNARDVATERRDLVPSVERLRDDSTADSARSTDNSDLHDSPVRAKKWPNSTAPALSADPTKGGCDTEQLTAFRWAILLLVITIEGTTVNLLNHAVGGVGRTEHASPVKYARCRSSHGVWTWWPSNDRSGSSRASATVPSACCRTTRSGWNSDLRLCPTKSIVSRCRGGSPSKWTAFTASAFP